jgi:hypothetical protein
VSQEPGESPDLGDVPAEGMFRALDDSDEQADARAAEQEMSREEANEWGRQANYRARQLAAENARLRARLGIEPGAPLEGAESEQSSPQSSYRGNVDDTSYSVDSAPASEYDLVLEPLRVSREELRELVKELVREQLPRQRSIAVHIPNEGMARVDSLEVLTKLFPSLVLVVAQLAARATRVPEEDALWSLGVEDEIAGQMNQVARAAPRRVKEQIRSRSF